jgi:transcriptional regulator with XRE-family HTH domain
MSPQVGYRRFKKNPWDLIPEGRLMEAMKPDEILGKLGSTIRQIRRARRMTQEDLAEIAGVNVKHLGEVERGNGNPTLQFLLKIAGALGTEMNDFFVSSPAQEDEIASTVAEIIALIRKLDQNAIQKLHKIIRVVVE